MKKFTSIEICAGAGGQALGLESAGFDHLLCIEIDSWAAKTLSANRPTWVVHEGDLRSWVPQNSHVGIDLLAGGVPCPPFSLAGKQLGPNDERDLFPEVLRLARELNPRSLMIENVKGLLSSRFQDYRNEILDQLRSMGYECDWRVVTSADYGVPQLRPRSVLVALKADIFPHFTWPKPLDSAKRVTVGEALFPLMQEKGWLGAKAWAESATDVAPTLVGGSKKHGGADLGPTRAKKSWLEKLGVDAKGIAEAAPEKDFSGNPRLTIPMVARLQGFPGDWSFAGGKTAQYRQIGNAFPPPVAEAIGSAIRDALQAWDQLN